MKYNLLKKIIGLDNFETQNDNLLYICTSKNLILNNEIIYDQNNLVSFVKDFNGNIVFSTSDNNIYFYDSSTTLLVEDYSLSEKKYNNEKIYISKRISRGVFETFLFSIKEKKKTLITEIPLFVENEYNIFCNGSVLKKENILNNIIDWEINLGDCGVLRKILGVINKKLWVSMYRGGIDKNENTLIALDIDSGQINYQIPNNYDISDCFVELIPEQSSILSIHGKINTHPADSPLIEINANTGEIIRNQRIESLYSENLKIGFWKVLNDKIYFTANKDVLNGTHIGVLDYHTLEILWASKVDEMRGGFIDLQVTENKIYALDKGNQLHVFEKE